MYRADADRAIRRKMPELFQLGTITISQTRSLSLCRHPRWTLTLGFHQSQSRAGERAPKKEARKCFLKNPCGLKIGIHWAIRWWRGKAVTLWPEDRLYPAKPFSTQVQSLLSTAFRLDWDRWFLCFLVFVLDNICSRMTIGPFVVLLKKQTPLTRSMAWMQLQTIKLHN